MSLETAEATTFYELNYECIARQMLLPNGKVQILGPSFPLQCRFCGNGPPDVKFRNNAQIMPEYIGLGKLRSNFECDACDTLFETSIERDFGNWVKPICTLMKVATPLGCSPRHGLSDAFYPRLEQQGVVLSPNDAILLEKDDKTCHVKIRLFRGAYVPRNVMKCLVKIALRLLPEEELKHFQTSLIWVRSINDRIFFGSPLFSSFDPGLAPVQTVLISLLRRRADAQKVPYLFLIMRVGAWTFQLAVPSARDGAMGCGSSIKPFPTLYEMAGHGAAEKSVDYFTGRELVPDSFIDARINYGSSYMKISSDAV